MENENWKEYAPAMENGEEDGENSKNVEQGVEDYSPALDPPHCHLYHHICC